jgi:hypothetical protein
MLNGIKLNRYIYAVIVLAVFAGFFGTAKTASAGMVCGSWSPTNGLWRNTPQTFILTGSYINCAAGDICYALESSGGGCTVNHDYIKPTSAPDPHSPYNNSNGCDVVINNPYHTMVCNSPPARIDTVSPAMSINTEASSTSDTIFYIATWQDTLSGLSSCIIYLDGSPYTIACGSTKPVVYRGGSTKLAAYYGSFPTADAAHFVYLYGKDAAGNSATTAVYNGGGGVVPGGGVGGDTGGSARYKCSNKACVRNDVAGSYATSSCNNVCAVGDGTCGDGFCVAPESCSSCRTDCGACPPPTPTYSLTSTNNLSISRSSGDTNVACSNKTTITVDTLGTGYDKDVTLSVGGWGGFASTSPSGFSINSPIAAQVVVDKSLYDTGSQFSVCAKSGASPGPYTIHLDGKGSDNLVRSVNVKVNIIVRNPGWIES